MLLQAGSQVQQLSCWEIALVVFTAPKSLMPACCLVHSDQGCLVSGDCMLTAPCLDNPALGSCNFLIDQGSTRLTWKGFELKLYDVSTAVHSVECCLMSGDSKGLCSER
jgi:hypothetical protein